MKKTFLQAGFLLFTVVVLASLWVGSAAASPTTQDDPVARGKYLAVVAGCVTCHTPYQARIDLKNPAPDDLLKMGLAENDVLDLNARLLAGGRPFDLGPGGVVFTRNLTPDKETGLGDWTDDEIKAAFRTGKSRKGNILIPVMPYPIYNNMSDADASAIVAYLRTIPAVKNSIPPAPAFPGLQAMPARSGITAPNPADTAARGVYLMTAVMPCTDCHTPIDTATGQPVMSKYMGGGQPFEGPWGIVYGGNLTPHEKFGISKWSDADIRRVLSSGVRPDGRRVVLMPWQWTAQLSEQDAQAVVSYFRKNVQPVEREVPAAALNPTFVQKVELPATQAAASASNNMTLYIVLGIVALVVVLGVVVFLMRRPPAASAK